MLLLKLLALAAAVAFVFFLYWIVNRKRDEVDVPIDDEVIDDVPVIDPPIEVDTPPVDPPVDIPESEVRHFWYKIWRIAQGRPPIEIMKKSLSDKEFEYYLSHRSEFKLGAPLIYDALGRKK